VHRLFSNPESLHAAFWKPAPCKDGSRDSNTPSTAPAAATHAAAVEEGKEAGVSEAEAEATEASCNAEWQQSSSGAGSSGRDSQPGSRPPSPTTRPDHRAPAQAELYSASSTCDSSSGQGWLRMKGPHDQVCVVCISITFKGSTMQGAYQRTSFPVKMNSTIKRPWALNLNLNSGPFCPASPLGGCAIEPI